MKKLILCVLAIAAQYSFAGSVSCLRNETGDKSLAQITYSIGEHQNVTVSYTKAGDFIGRTTSSLHQSLIIRDVNVAVYRTGKIKSLQVTEPGTGRVLLTIAPNDSKTEFNIANIDGEFSYLDELHVYSGLQTGCLPGSDLDFE